MASFNWQAVVNIVEKEFPSYIPVPSKSELGDYKVLSFACLEGKESSVHQLNRFCYYGHENDILTEHKYPTRDRPKVAVKNLWAYNESSRKRSSEARTGGSKGSPDKVVLSTLNLGTISEHKFHLEDLEDWLKKSVSLKSYAAKKALDGKLFIVYSAIMAEKLVITEGNEDSGVKEKVYTPVPDPRQSKEVVGFPVGFKLAKVQSTHYHGRISGVQAYTLKN